MTIIFIDFLRAYAVCLEVDVMKKDPLSRQSRAR
jgi:hypothetical protein